MQANDEFITLETARPRIDDDDFDLDMDDDADIISTTLPVNAQSAYELFCEIERTPEWIGAIRSVQTLAFDDRGRPERAAFLASYGRASAGYTLDYRYDEDRRLVAWETPGDLSTRVSGRAHFVSLSDRACMMHYQLEMTWPEFFGLGHSFYGEHPASAALNDFRDFVTRKFVLC